MEEVKTDNKSLSYFMELSKLLICATSFNKTQKELLNLYNNKKILLAI